MTCPICYRHLVYWVGNSYCTCSWEAQKAAWEQQEEEKEEGEKEE